MAEFNILTCVFCEAKVPRTVGEGGGRLAEHLQLWHNITVKREIEAAMGRAAGEMAGEVEDLSKKRSRETMWAEGDPVFNHPDGLKIEMGEAFSLKPTPKERVAMVLSGHEGGQRPSLQMPRAFWPSPSLSSEGTLPGDELSEEVDDSPSARDEPLVKKMKKQQMNPASVEQMKPKLTEMVLGKDDHLLVRTTPVLVVKEASKGGKGDAVNIGGSPDTSDTKVEAVKDLVASKRSLEKPSKVKCEECDLMCLKGNLKRHMRLLHGDKEVHVRPHICPEEGCGETFVKIGVLKNHIKQCHAANDGNLENCNDSRQELDTANTTEEAEHNLVNKDSDNEQCGGFLNSPGFARNGKTALYQCDIEGCDRIYVNRQSLVRHNRIDHDTELSPTVQLDSAMLNFKCKVPQCGAVFLKKGHLVVHSKREHSKTHQSQEATFPCGMPQCNKRFAHKGNLGRHIKEVHGGNRRSVEAGKKDEENTFVIDAEEINIDIEDVHADTENHEQEVGLDDDGTMEVVMDTAKLFEAGAREVEINSGEGNVEYEEEVDNNADNRQEIKDGEADVESFEVAPLWVGHQCEDEIY